MALSAFFCYLNAVAVELLLLEDASVFEPSLIRAAAAAIAAVTLMLLLLLAVQFVQHAAYPHKGRSFRLFAVANFSFSFQM